MKVIMMVGAGGGEARFETDAKDRCGIYGEGRRGGWENRTCVRGVPGDIRNAVSGETLCSFGTSFVLGLFGSDK